ncbi:uncharacterized protein V1518DRAFT_411461 [Limtongia smithiae]|uniref:uncharacterized protein n=1 Tax=Limtongia smithiae TaxID=1125753 RepID=UPI0034CD068A
MMSASPGPGLQSAERSDSNDDDDEELLQLRLAKIRAEQEEIEAKIALKLLQKKKRAAHSTHDAALSSQPIVQQQQQQQQEDSATAATTMPPPATPSPRTPKRYKVANNILMTSFKSLSSDDSDSDDAGVKVQVKATPPRTTLSPEQQKIVNEEIVKRRKLEYSPTISNSLLAHSRTDKFAASHSQRLERGSTAGLGRHRSSTHGELQVPKSPSPIKPKQSDMLVSQPARMRLGLNKSISAKDVNLTRSKSLHELSQFNNMPAISVKETDRAVQPPTLGLRSTRLANHDTIQRKALEQRQGTVYANMDTERTRALKKRYQKEEDTSESQKSSFAKSFMALHRPKSKMTKENELENKGSSAPSQDKKVKEDRPESKSSSRSHLQGFSRDALKKEAAAESSEDSDDELEIQLQAKSAEQSQQNQRRTLPKVSSSSSHSSNDVHSSFDSPRKTDTPPSTPPRNAKSYQSSTDLYDPYSKLPLHTRYMDHERVVENLADYTTFTVSSLYGEITPPEYEPPAYGFWALLGVVARKSPIMYMKRNGKPFEPRRKDGSVDDGGGNAADWAQVIEAATADIDDEKQPKHGFPKRRQQQAKEKQSKEDDEASLMRRRYFMLTLTDLKTDVEIFISGKQIEKFWKLRAGDLVAVLNPGVWPGKKNDPNFGTKRGFKLNLTEADDTILEIGRAQAFGICKSLTRKQTECTNWVNLAKTEYCEFHIELAVRKTSNRRAEINKGTWMMSPKKNGQRMVLTEGSHGRQGLLPDMLAPRADRHGSGGRVFVVQGGSGSDDELFDRPKSSYSRPWK